MMTHSVAFDPAHRRPDHVARAPRTNGPPASMRSSRPRSVNGPQRPSQVPILDGTTRLTGSPALAGGQARHGRHHLQAIVDSMGVTRVPARPSMARLGPAPVGARTHGLG